jgi:hypothetical protein
MVKRRGPQAAAAVHDDYDDFSRWVNQALRRANLTPGDEGVTDPHRQWESLTAPNRAALAQALREFWTVERRFNHAWKNVVALMKALERKSRQGVKRYDELHGYLQTRLNEATNVQGIIETLKERHKNERFDACVRNLLKHHDRSWRHSRAEAAFFIQQSEELRSASPVADNKDLAPDLAAIIEEGYTAFDSDEDGDEDESDRDTNQQPGPQPYLQPDQQAQQRAQQQAQEQIDQQLDQQPQQQPQRQPQQQGGKDTQGDGEADGNGEGEGEGAPAPNPLSSLKRKPGDEQIQGSFPTKKQDRSPDKSAQPGASRSGQPDIRVLDPERTGEKTNRPFLQLPKGGNYVEQPIEATPGAFPLGTQDTAMRAVASSRNFDFPPLCGLSSNELPPTNVAWLYDQQKDFEHHLKEWCQLQLIGVEYKTMGDLELFAKFARQYILARSEGSFNWEEEDFLPAPPNKFPPRPPNAPVLVSWLYAEEEAFTVGFRSWCKLQLDALNGRPLDVMEAFAEGAYGLFQSMPREHDWEIVDFVITDVPNLDGSHGEDEPIPNTRRSSASPYRRVDQKKKRVPSAPVLKPGEDDAHPDGVSFLQKAHAAEAWQPLQPSHPDAFDDSFDWPILLLQPGPHTLRPGSRLPWLYQGCKGFPRQFARWCKRHLDPTARDYNGLGALDSFATAASTCYFSVKPAAARNIFDWDKDELLLAPPQFILTDLHLLYYLIGHESPALQNYFHRQLDRNVVARPPDIQDCAKTLKNIYMLRRQDPRTDWSLMDDCWQTKDPASLVTSNYPLQGVRADGHWTVRHRRQPCLFTTAKTSLT